MVGEAIYDLVHRRSQYPGAEPALLIASAQPRCAGGREHGGDRRAQRVPSSSLRRTAQLDGRSSPHTKRNFTIRQSYPPRPQGRPCRVRNVYQGRYSATNSSKAKSPTVQTTCPIDVDAFKALSISSAARRQSSAMFIGPLRSISKWAPPLQTGKSARPAATL